MTLRLGIIFSCMPFLLAGCAREQQTEADNFRQSFRKSFTESCIAGSTSGPNALSAKLAADKCACMADYLVANYSPDELGQLSGAGSSEATSLMDAAIAACK
ncbi:MAG: hypothetical protein WCR32_03975 [Geobacter sp.]